MIILIIIIIMIIKFNNKNNDNDDDDDNINNGNNHVDIWFHWWCDKRCAYIQDFNNFQQSQVLVLF